MIGVTFVVIALEFLLEGLESIYRLVRELKQLHFVLEEGVRSIAVPAIPTSLKVLPVHEVHDADQCSFQFALTVDQST